MRLARLAALLAGIALIACTGSSVPASPPTSGATVSVPPPTLNPTPAPVAPAAGGPGGSTHVRLGIKPGGLSDAPIYIAMERGYFKQENIDLETVNFDSAARMIAPLGLEQIEVAAGATSANLYNAFDRQIPIKIVADKGSQPPGRGYEALVVRKDLIDSGKVKDYKDLKGLTIAIGSKANTDEHAVAIALGNGGLRLSDVNEVELGFPDMVAAMANGSIDAALELEPFVAKMTQTDTGVRWKGVDEIAPNIQTANVIYSPRFSADRDAGTRWMVAYLKGVRDFNDALDNGKDKAEILRIIQTTAKLDAPTMEKLVWPGFNRDGKFNLESLASDQTFYIEEGAQKQQVDLKDVVDTTFIEAAVERLGPGR